MPTIPVVNNLIEDEKQTIVATGGQVVDLDEEARPKRDNGIDDIDPDTSPAPEDATNAGSGGTQPDNTPLDPYSPLVGRTFVNVRRANRMIITDFSEGFIQDCIDGGGRAIVVFKDGTERQVQWSEVFNPFPPSQTATINIGNIAAAQNQHFWNDDNGAHVTDNTKVMWNNEYQKTNHGELSNPTLLHPWHNIIVNSLGVLLRRGLINLTAISRDSFVIYDGVGNNSTNVVANFGSSGVQIGKDTTTHLVIDSSSINVYDGNGDLASLHSANIDADHAVIADLDVNYAHLTNGVIDNATISYANVDDLDANYAHLTNGVIDNATIDHADVNDLDANYAHLTNGVIDNATIDHADVNDLDVNYAHLTNGVIDNATISYASIDDLDANYAHLTNGVIDNATIDHADVNDLDVNYAHLTNGVIDNAKISYADVNNLSANYAHLTNGVIDNATIDQANVDNLAANYAHLTNGVIDNAKISYADVNDMAVHYAQIDLANVNNAWIVNGIIKDGSIVNAQIHDVSANKLTAGTIDASVITVTNLRASDISVQRINGQVVTGKTLVDALQTHETDISSLDTKIDNAVDDLNGRIDAQIQTYTSTSIPTLNNYPASDWNTNALKQEHVGDILYVLNSGNQADGYTYRFAYDNTDSAYKWVLIKDNQVTAALQRIIDAEGDIDNLQTFQSETTTWKNNTDDEISSIKTNQTSLTGRVGTLETTKVDSTTFNQLSQTVSGNSASITSLTTRTDTLEDDLGDLSGTVTTVSSTVNTVSQTASGNSSKITNLINRLGTSADGTAGANDVVKKVSDVTQDLDGFKTTVSSTYATKSALDTEINQRKASYVTSTTGPAIAAKEGVCSNFELHTGARISCTFSNANTSASPTLNVNGTGAKQIRSYVGAPLSEAEYEWASGSTLDLVYDGTYWRIQDNGSLNRIYNAETSINQNAEAIELRATKTEVEGLAAELAEVEETAGGLSYSHFYEHTGNLYTFTASLKQGSKDITNDVDPMRFVWYLKDESGIDLVSRGITYQVSGTEIGYRGSVIGGYEDAGLHNYHLVDNIGRNFVTKDTGKRLVARIIWED